MTNEETIYSPVHLLGRTHFAIESDDILIEIEAKSDEVDLKAETYLIAARHDLLAACEEALATLKHHKADIYPFPGEPRIITLLRAAIAKVKGETDA